MGGGKKVDPISPPASFGDSIQVRYGTIPTYTPYVQERWELVAYVNSTVIDDVAQPVYRESSVSGALNDAYGLSRLSTVGGTEALPVADTYLEDGLGSVSAVIAGDGRIAASYAYSPWGEAAVDVGEFGGPALSGLGYQPELSHYGYNGEESTGASGLQYLRAPLVRPDRRCLWEPGRLLGRCRRPRDTQPLRLRRGQPHRLVRPHGPRVAFHPRENCKAGSPELLQPQPGTLGQQGDLDAAELHLEVFENEDLRAPHHKQKHGQAARIWWQAANHLQI